MLKSKEHMIKALPYLIMLLLMLFILGNKKNLHVDETYSYGLSNHLGDIAITYEDGKIYSPSDEVYLNYLSADKDNNFNYKIVWENQASDVHPPLYYVLLHTICSLFSETFSIWYAAIINIAFMLLTLYVANKLISILIEDDKYINLFSIMFVLSAGLLSAVSFLRMYILAMFLCTLLSYLIVKNVIRGGTQTTNKEQLKYYIQLFAISILGALTHYYCIVYLVFTCITLGIYLIIKKQWKNLVFTVCTETIAGMLSIMIFPSMIKHMFMEGRGTEAIQNLQGTKESYFDRIKVFYEILNTQLFGGMLTYFIVFAIILVLVYVICDKSFKLNNKITIAITLVGIIPIILYFLIVSKMAAYLTDRYIFPIYAVAMIYVFYCIYKLSSKFVADNVRWLIMIVLIAIFTVNGWKNIGWEYLYNSNQSFLDKTVEYSDVDSLVVYNEKWRTQSAYYEVSNYSSVTFVHENNLSAINNLENTEVKELMVLLITDNTATLDTIISKYPMLDKYEKIGGYAYTTTYHLYSSQPESNIQSYTVKNYNKNKYLGNVWNEKQSIEDIVLQDNPFTIKALELSDGYSELWIGHNVFDIVGGTLKDGTNVRAFGSNNTDAQKWKLLQNQDGSYLIESFNNNLVLTTNETGEVFISEKNGSDYQKWWVE